MRTHSTIKDIYGPGTFIDAAYAPLPAECHRLLKHFASVSPGFTNDDAALRCVEFHGDHLPIIPGPLKSQALVSLSRPTLLDLC
jgi:hypothetical protein